MIALSPKALRFARLAAEERFSGIDEPYIADLRRTEHRHIPELRDGVLRTGYLEISDDLGRFCLDTIRWVLKRPNASDDWDDNDLMFLKSVSTHLSQSLAVSPKV